MATVTDTYRVSVGYINNADKQKTLSYSGCKEQITQTEATALTKALYDHGDDILKNGLQEVTSIAHFKVETTKTEFTPYTEPDGE